MIRKAEKSDIPAIQSLLVQVNKVHADGRPDIFKSGGSKYTNDQLNTILVNPDTPVFVYDDQAVLKGYIFCIREETYETTNLYPKKTLYIDDLCVDEAYRREHIGKSLYEFVKVYAKDNHYDRITLHVWDLNPAARVFYEKMGMHILYTAMEQTL